MQYNPDIMSNLREHFANRNKPRQPDPEVLARQQADMEFRAGLERRRQADERALMDDLAGVFARRTAQRAAERAAR